MTYVQLMRIVVTVAYGLVGLTPSWCDWCGNMSTIERPFGEHLQVLTDDRGAYRCPLCGGYMDVQPMGLEG